MRFEPVLNEIKQNLERSPNFCKFKMNFCENLEEFEFGAVQRYVNLVDLEKC